MSQNHQSSRINNEIWERSIPIDRARYRFGDKSLVEEYNALLDSKPGAFSFLGQMTNIMADLTTGPVSLDPERRTTQEERDRLDHLSNAIDNHCIKRLQKRELIAIGFSIPRHPDDLPRILPLEILVQGRLNLDNNKAVGDGLEFHAVRVFPANALKKYTPTPTRAGRPSKRDLIKKVYAECRNEGLIDYAKPQKAAIEVIRSRIQTRYSDEYGLGKGFGPEVIRDCIADDFRQRANAQKL
ncbi:MAG: hypothetical protein RJS98_14405 [Rhodospirillaceae bacterium]